jgi:hypothetical protein
VKCGGSRVLLLGAFISFEKNFYRLPFTPPSLVRRIGPSNGDGVVTFTDFVALLRLALSFSLHIF